MYAKQYSLLFVGGCFVASILYDPISLTSPHSFFLSYTLSISFLPSIPIYSLSVLEFHVTSLTLLWHLSSNFPSIDSLEILTIFKIKNQTRFAIQTFYNFFFSFFFYLHSHSFHEIIFSLLTFRVYIMEWTFIEFYMQKCHVDAKYRIELSRENAKDGEGEASDALHELMMHTNELT